MAQFSDFINRIFSNERTQGLSGGAEAVMENDPASAFYAARMRKHRTDEDLVTSPEFLWATASFGGRKGGLRAHLLAERGDGIANFTDVLLVINQPDARLAAVLDGEPWTERAARAIGDRFTQFCEKDKFELRYGTRPLRFWIVADGGSEMLGHDYGLAPGEFITGLVPNLYVGPARRSRPVLAVHLNLPGAWEGYREVGRIYSDQMLFTLGRHWLDNFHHEALREPGLYRLQQYPDGSLVHTISPELQHRYLVRSDQVEGGASVLTIAEWGGSPVAYLVLAVIDHPSEATASGLDDAPTTVQEPMTVTPAKAPKAAEKAAEKPSPEKPAEKAPERPTRPAAPATQPAPAAQPTPAAQPASAAPAAQPTPAAKAAPEPARPIAGPAAAAPAAPASETAGGAALTRGPPPPPPAEPPVRTRAAGDKLTRTIVPGAVESRIFTLQERGALLQKVHFANYMEGYDVYIGAGTAVATQMANPKATLQVRGGRVSLLINEAGVTVDGQPMTVGKSRPITGDVAIEVDGKRVEYRDLSKVKADGWPYLGELRRAEGGSYLDFGAAHRIGRDRRCKVRLPDEPQNDNIAWLPSVGGGTTIRSRTGDIPKSRFYTDSIMVASEHAEIELAGEPILRSLAKQCYTFVRRGSEVFSLVPRSENFHGAYEVALRPEDEILVGNCLFQVSFPPSEEDAARNLAPIVMPEPPPPPLARVDLDDASDVPAAPQLKGRSFDRPEAELPKSDLAPGAGNARRNRGMTLDVPAAFGLGEAGAAPRPVQIGMATSSNAAAFGKDGAEHTMAVERSEVRPRMGPAIDERPIPDPSAPMRVPSPSLNPPSASPNPPTSSPGPLAAAPKSSRPPPPMVVDQAQLDEPPRVLEPDPETEVDTPLMQFNNRIEGPRASLVPPGPTVEPLPPLDPDQTVLSVEEAQWQFELSRPGKLVQIGWMVSGEVVVGNHRGCGVVVPEVRAFPEQAFMTLDYFRLNIRGKKGRIELLQEGEAKVISNKIEVNNVDTLDGVRMEIVRRDQNLEPDFDVTMDLQLDPALPDPRARMLTIDTSDRLTAALFTTGLPLRSGRRLRLGVLEVTATFDGEQLVLSDYLGSYKLAAGGFRPCFVRDGAKPYRTLPEDGAPVVLHAGDTLIAASCAYRFQPA